MRTLMISFLLIASSFQALSQYLHMPTEINLILKESKITYIFDTLRQEAPIKELSFYQDQDSGNIPDSILLAAPPDYETSPQYEKYRIKAEKYTEKQKFDKTLEQYLQAFEQHDSTDQWGQALIIQNIARCYNRINDLENALIWLKKGLHTNVLPSQFHKELADTYQLNGEKSLALTAIVKAHLYDTKDSLTKASMLEYFASNHLQPVDWSIAPQFQLLKDNQGIVRILYKDLPWKAYAACKAVWQNEPGYAEDMKNLSTENNAQIEEKECLLNALITWENMESGKEEFPALNALAKALPMRIVDTYLFYETRLRYKPDLIYTLTSEEIEQVVKYLIQVRTQHISAEQ